MTINLVTNNFNQHARILKRCIDERIPAEYSDDGVTIKLCIDDTIGAEESYLISAVDKGWKITGADEMGLFFGIGKFLHSAKWTETELIPNPPQHVMTPACSFRATYFAIHFYNWYQMAPLEEIQQYLEEMLLWGYSTVICIIPIINSDSFEDEVFLTSAERTRKIFRLAKELGMKIGTLLVPNQGLRSAPEELSADLSYDLTGTNRGWLGRNLCPAKSGTLEYLKGIWLKNFEQYTDIGLDYIITWPYDEGGCGCAACSPWGANGYCELVKEIHNMGVQHYPNAKYVVSTWTFDVPDKQGEYEGFYQRLKEDLNWVDYILVDSHEEFPRYPLEHEKIKPIVNFPEMSMWRMYPWGGRGASPLPERFQNIWDSAKHILDGGLPYSEGIYEDITKIQFAGYYWEPNKNYRQILSEYISYEYANDVCEQVLEMLSLIERNHVQVANLKEPDYEAAERVICLAEEVNEHLGMRAQKSWRWRIVYIRAWIDHIVYLYYKDKCEYNETTIRELRRTPRSYLEHNEKAQQLLQELCRYYHCVSDNGENMWTLPPVKDGKVLSE